MESAAYHKLCGKLNCFIVYSNLDWIYWLSFVLISSIWPPQSGHCKSCCDQPGRTTATCFSPDEDEGNDGGKRRKNSVELRKLIFTLGMYWEQWFYNEINTWLKINSCLLGYPLENTFNLKIPHQDRTFHHPLVCSFHRIIWGER